ncbi:MAG TPA: hypothetical protein VFA20_12230 [Myxococcaceae bacterium]|nr:hypothetical protein [Myxococcaceae bacterium]
MADQLLLFMAEEDEVAFLRFLERFSLEVYPRRIPEGWTPFRAEAAAHGRLPEGELYLAAPEMGDVLVDKVKRGPDKGSWRVDEVRSPVMFWERSRVMEGGELLAGQLWAETSITEQTGRRTAAPDRFRALVQEVEHWLKKTFRKSDPPGYFIGPRAARMAKEGLALWGDEHKPSAVRVWR